mgnify:CR=1 FL=1
MITMTDASLMNILKVRDDCRPVCFTEVDGGGYELCEDEPEIGWIRASDGKIDTHILRNRIEPWLTSLFQSEHLSLLAGSGLSTAVSLMASGKSGADMKAVHFSAYQEQIDNAASISAEKAGRIKENKGNGPNIEDQIRVANELLRGLEILGNTIKNNKRDQLRSDIEAKMSQFADSVLAGETVIAESDEIKREKAFNVLVTFLMSFASRTGTRDRVNIFTTNYDRVIEMGAELAGMHLLDRFVGNLSPLFRSSRLNVDMHYNPPGMRGEPRYLEGVARFTKLHGSIDWVQTENGIRRIGLPFGADSIEPFFNAPGLRESTAYKLMIYPNSAKDVETASYPYVDLFRDFAAAVCRPNSTLVTYGYSFGDDHINRVIKDMLTIPSTHLVVISYDDPMGRIMRIYDEWGRSAQMSLLIGPALADLSILSEYYLPKPAIDKATFRMAELLRQRMGSEDQIEHSKDIETEEAS